MERTSLGGSFSEVAFGREGSKIGEPQLNSLPLVPSSTLNQLYRSFCLFLRSFIGVALRVPRRSNAGNLDASSFSARSSIGRVSLSPPSIFASIKADFDPVPCIGSLSDVDQMPRLETDRRRTNSSPLPFFLFPSFPPSYLRLRVATFEREASMYHSASARCDGGFWSTGADREARR